MRLLNPPTGEAVKEMGLAGLSATADGAEAGARLPEEVTIFGTVDLF